MMVSAPVPASLRLVTYRHVAAEDVDEAVKRIAGVLAETAVSG